MRQYEVFLLFVIVFWLVKLGLFFSLFWQREQKSYSKRNGNKNSSDKIKGRHTSMEVRKIMIQSEMTTLLCDIWEYFKNHDNDHRTELCKQTLQSLYSKYTNITITYKYIVSTQILQSYIARTQTLQFLYSKYTNITILIEQMYLKSTYIVLAQESGPI